MADKNYYYTKYQQQNQANPSKFYTNFLYKALLVSIFLAILPLFPSQAPEFINQTLDTRGWEFLHLVFVGIAVSYGLFSKRNDESEKENNTATSNNATTNSKFDNAQSYLSRFLQVSSVFDDDVDSPSKSEENKVQTWNSQYYRNDPVVVVAEEKYVLDKQQRVTNSKLGEKPLLLPVRSLKSRVVDADVHNGSSEESIGVSGSISRSNSNSGSKRFSSNSMKNKKRDYGGFDYLESESEEKLKDNVVLPSPIPWRSRSGRMEMKEESDSPPPYTLPPSMEESAYNWSLKAQVPLSARSSSATSSPKHSPSPKKFSHSPSSEVQGKIAEDFLRRKSICRSPPPPPPPPPPPSVIRKSSSSKPSSRAIHDEERELKRSFTSEPKSVRTLRSNDPLGGNNRKSEKRLKEVEASAMERTGRKTTGFDQSSFQTERLNCESLTFMPEPTFVEFPEEEREEIVEKLVMEFDGESEMETEEEEEGEGGDIAGSSFASGIATSLKKEAAAASSSASDGGPDVDKKADEFIAKFREQIRLQRIESIKRTSGQISRYPSR